MSYRFRRPLLNALHAFVVFAEHRNFTRAARRPISQPALHVKINKLGAVLGVELYQRATGESCT